VRADRGWEHIPTILFFYVHSSYLRALAEKAVTAQVSAVRRLCHRLARCISPKTQRVTVRWQNWGPKTTRWIEHEDGSVRQSLSGTRCAITKWAGEEVQLLDFNPGRVRRLEYLVEKKDTEWENLRELLVNSQSTILAGKYFKHDIVSHLPYFEIRRRGAAGQLLIDDQLVVQTLAQVCLFQFTTRVAQRLIYFSTYFSTTVCSSYRAILFVCILFEESESEISR
jgi:5-methylcytosine-specific restriction endonuclease McrA